MMLRDYTNPSRAANDQDRALQVEPDPLRWWAAEVIRDIADRYGDMATLSWQTLRDLQVPRQLKRSLGSNVERPEGVPLLELLWSAAELLHIEQEIEERLQAKSDIRSLRMAVINAIDECFGPDDGIGTFELWRAEEEFTDSFPPDLSA